MLMMRGMAESVGKFIDLVEEEYYPEHGTEVELNGAKYDSSI